MRPNYHITAWKNWLNDPNGLIFLDGTYHAFYQHHPDGHHWGPMHWGHVTSKDLYRWKHEPIALYPDEGGTIFSGSAILDENNVSGLGPEGSSPLLVYYSRHTEEGYQDQCLAYSLDGYKFEKYINNPIIENYGIADFRDPKVFYYEADQSWKIILSVKDHIEIYGSTNLIYWTHLSDFNTDEVYPGVWECPDLFPLTYEGKTYWVLILSIGSTPELGHTITHYFLGDFDGKTFTQTVAAGGPRLIDEGPDNYASVSFSRTDEIMLLGWALSGIYGPDTPDHGYCGQFTGPRTPFLYKDKDGKLSLGFKMIPLPADIERSEILLDQGGQTTLPEQALLMQFKAQAGEDFSLKLYNEIGEEVSFSRQADTLELNRAKAVAEVNSQYMDWEIYQKRQVKSKLDQTSSFTLFYDAPLLEVFAEEGTTVFTMALYPKESLNRLEIKGAEDISIEALAPYEIPQCDEPYLYKDEERR